MFSRGVVMGTVSSSLNPGVSELLQTLSNINSPVLSSPAVVSALEKAPESDIVQLSNEALQLQSVDTMFGISNGSSSSGSDMSSLLENLDSSATASGTSTANSQSASGVLASASAADQLANYQAALQASVSQGLFGTASSNGLIGSLFNTVA
jgi:hypothetical protein